MRFAFAFTLVLACNAGGDDGTNDASASKDATTDDVHDSSIDASDAGADVAKAPSSTRGSVTLAQSKNGGATSYAAAASFETILDAGPPSGCAPQVGSCCFAWPTDSGVPSVTPVSAGTITLKYAAQTIGAMTPTGTTYTALSSSTTTSLQWLAGDLVSVTAAGDTVHAFGGNVTTALLFTNVTPALSQTPTAISKSQDFTLTWTQGTGAIQIVLTQNAAGAITCSAANDTGTMTIDKSLLANFTGTSGAIDVTRTVSIDASPDNADVTLVSTAETGGAVTFTN